MNNLNQYITEKFKIHKNIKIQKYNYHPSSWDELYDLLRKLLKERGPDANLNDIDVSKVTTFYDKETKAGLFEELNIQNIDISLWDVSNVTNMQWTFLRCEKFNCDLSLWDVSNVTNMQGMFNGCKKFEGKGLSQWNVSNVEDMSYLFAYSSRFNEDISNWNLSSIITINNMFKSNRSFKQDLSNWKKYISSNTQMFFAFEKSLLEKNPPEWYH